MLSKEECKRALENAVDTGIIKKDWNVLNQLIEEHFDDENQLKFYYCESEDSYLIGLRVDNFYYAHWHKGIGFVFDMSRYLPWGKHVVDENTLWKEHTYPSEPKEIDFNTWIKGFIKSICNEDVKSYKFEDLKPNMWVWDDIEKLICQIGLISKNAIHRKYIDGTISDSPFKENRFFPVQCANLEIEN